MKRIFTLSLLALFVALGANAQAKKSWDFTKWSSTTLSNLEADAAAGGLNSSTWTDLEKANGTATENDHNAYWLNNATAGAFTANGAPIPELEGIELASGTGTRWLAIAHNVGSTSLGEYAGSKYLWMGGKDKSLIIKGVKPGAIIEADVESHKPAEGRGINLLVNGANVEFLEGTATPTTLTHCKWQIPTEGIETETVDVTIKNTNGCHIYRVDIDGGDDPTEEAKKVAYIHQGSDLDADFVYIALTSSGSIEATPINITTEAITHEALLEYDVVVIAPTVTFESYTEVFNRTLFFVPVINLSPALYTMSSGLGALIHSTDGTMSIPEDVEESELFTDVPIDEGILDLGIESYTAIFLGEKLADDKVYAKFAGDAAIHVHNPARNAYLYLPGELTQSEVAMTLVPNAVSMIASSKRGLAKTANPVITTVQSNGMTTVTITCATPGATVLYKVAGDEDWYAYNNPLEVTQDLTIASMAFADGYLDSDEVTAEVKIATQTAAPTISVDKQSGKSIVTISGEGTIYYNYAGETAVAASAAYAEAIELTRPRTITAFAIADGQLQSEAVSVDVEVEGSVLRDTKVSSFLADKALYHTPMEGTPNWSSKVAYYFEWNKTKKSCFTDEVDHTDIVKDSEGNDSTVYYYKYADEQVFPAADAENIADYEWAIASRGQVVNWSSDAPMTGMVGDEGGRYPGTVDDAGCVSKANITFGAIEGEATANIVSLKKFVGPFDVEAYVGNGNSSSQPKAEIQISKDGVVWEKIADCNIWPVRRCYMRTVASYNGTDEVYVKLQNTAKSAQSAQVFEINILINTEENPTAISNAAELVKATAVGIYNLAGQKVSADYKGIVIKNGKKVVIK